MPDGRLLKGQLLVATPDLVDPNFHRTVVLVLEHTDAGAVGVVLNRPSETDLAEGLPQWREVAAEPRRFFVGGPVDQNVAMGLCRGGLPVGPDVGVRLNGGLGGLASLNLDLPPDEATGAGVKELRVFVGYAGWGGGQLEEEIAEGAWWVVDATQSDVFRVDAEDLWPAVLGRQPMPLRLFAGYPPDPNLN